MGAVGPSYRAPHHLKETGAKREETSHFIAAGCDTMRLPLGDFHCIHSQPAGLKLSMCLKEEPLGAWRGAFESLACQVYCHRNASVLWKCCCWLQLQRCWVEEKEKHGRLTNTRVLREESGGSGRVT